MEYKPNPIDTSSVVLPESVHRITEELAKNTHERWALQRLNDGWNYGEQRNDDQKTHPCLVPYEMLSHNEKNYDRETALETLKLIIMLGYDIVKVNE